MANTDYVFVLQEVNEGRAELLDVYTSAEDAFKGTLENERNYAEEHGDSMTFDYQEWSEKGRGTWVNTTGTTDAWVVTRKELR